MPMTMGALDVLSMPFPLSKISLQPGWPMAENFARKKIDLERPLSVFDNIAML